MKIPHKISMLLIPFTAFVSFVAAENRYSQASNTPPMPKMYKPHRIQGQQGEPTQFTRAVGSKFYGDGRPKRYVGNSIISFVPESAPQYRLFVQLQEKLMTLDSYSKMALLPPSSFHMTNLDLLTDARRSSRERWTGRLPSDASWTDINARFLKELAGVEFPSTMQMTYRGLKRTGSGVVVELNFANEETAQALENFRASASKQLGVTDWKAQTYVYHVSLAYVLLELNSEEEHQFNLNIKHFDSEIRDEFGVMDVPTGQLVSFESMFEFVPV